MIMTLVGKSIQDLRMMNPTQHFSINTAVRIQSLEALQDLHSIGYLHRNMKPGHIPIDRIEIGELQKIYMFDFGMARKYHPPFTIQYRGRKLDFEARSATPQFPATLSANKTARTNDCDSWLYMLIELTDGRLPWCDIQDMAQTVDWKHKVSQ